MTAPGHNRIVHVVGTRPNFMKAAPVLAALGALGHAQTLVHTGQHHDPLLSDVFFTDLGLPRPDMSLDVGAGRHRGHAAQTAALLVALDDALAQLAPRLLVVYGDVNSTLAAALVAAKTGVEIAHVEAGLRSFDLSMPEEVNRRLVDALSQVCLVTSADAVDNLTAEGVSGERIHLVGNPMIDSLHRVLPAATAIDVASRWPLRAPYALATLHRPANVDDPRAAVSSVEAVRTVAQRLPVVLPLHPRGRATLVAAGLDQLPHVHVVDPLGYLDFVALMASAALVLTDSGGVQEETTALRVPCLTLRPNTERPVTITAGTNVLVDATQAGQVDAAVSRALDGPTYDGPGPPLWDGQAGQRIAAVLSDYLASKTDSVNPSVSSGTSRK